MQEPVKTEKKVEYLELIYDLIFVFVIGRNNQLLHHITDGFIDGEMLLAYIVCTLAVIQIWNFSTYYINLFGRNGIREHVSLFVNMFLMYFIAEGTGSDYQAYYTQYHAAWALILLNIGIQYLIELRRHREDPVLSTQILRMALPLLIESALVVAALLAHQYAGLELSWAAILAGILLSFWAGGRSVVVRVDFPHLTERAMLYVVFTFGEMIIGFSGYFEGMFNVSSLYFALMGFLIVVGLFVSYETLYDHIVDREQSSNGLGYMLIHVFLIFAMNNITSALEFMRMEKVHLLPKMLFLIGSLLLYFICIFLLGRYAKKKCGFRGRFLAIMGLLAVCFVVLMLLLRNMMQLNILLTVVYVFAVFLLLRRRGREQAAPAASDSK